MAENVGTRFDRLPATEADREVPERPTQDAVITYFEDRFGIDRSRFEGYTFWEKGTGKIWAFAGVAPSPIAVEALGIHLLRTNQRHWKPTTDAMQRFGRYADAHIVDLSRAQATRFWRGETQEIEMPDTPGYVLVRHRLAGAYEPLGIGLAIRGELRSQIPKGRQRDLEHD